MKWIYFHACSNLWKNLQFWKYEKYIFFTIGAPEVKVGDTVVISLDEETLEKMQVGHGGWNNDMKFVCISFFDFFPFKE